MIEALIIVGAAGPWVAAYVGARVYSKRLEHTNGVYLQLLADEKLRVESLTRLLMAKAAPVEYSAYVEPHSNVEPFPENAIWDESGLYFAVPEES